MAGNGGSAHRDSHAPPWDEVEETIASETGEAQRRSAAADRLAELTATGEATTLEDALALVLDATTSLSP